MIKYYSKNQLLEAAYNSFVPLNSQKETCEAVASLIAQHLTYLQGLEMGFKSHELPSRSMLLIGRTGSGKTEILKRIGEVCGLQFGSIDASSLSAAGWKGLDLNDAVRNVINQAQNPKQFINEGGIILIDEMDKLAYSLHAAEYIASNPQQNFLKLLEKDYTIQGELKEDCRRDVYNISTEKILFVFAGAFSGLEKQLAKKYGKTNTIGFLKEESQQAEVNSDYLDKATMKDIEEYGILGELLGRIGTLQYIPSPTLQDYVALINGGNNSLYRKYEKMLMLRGVTLDISRKACILLGKDAETKNLGARALTSIMAATLAPAFDQIDNDLSITSVKIIEKNGSVSIKYDKSGKRRMLIAEPKTYLRYLIEEIPAKIFEEEGINQLCVRLTKEAGIDSEKARSAFYYCMQTFARYLALEVSEQDQSFESFVKLAGTLESESGTSTFEIMIKNAVERGCAESEKSSYERLKVFYDLYKELTSRRIDGMIFERVRYIEMISSGENAEQRKSEE